MISRLTGNLEPLATGRALVDVSGVAYEIAMPQREIAVLAPDGARTAEPVSVITDLIQRDDGPVLFAFLDWRGRTAFRTLRKLPGLGPSRALEILDHLGIDALHAAIGAHDQRALTGVPGIGPKMARRILTEWPDRPDAGDGGPAPVPARAQTPQGPREEALEGLKGLGYSHAEADDALAAIADANPDADARTLLSAALRHAAQQRMRPAS